MAELADKAISEGIKGESFTNFRKLTACGIALVAGVPAAVAATTSDKSVFQKSVEYAVGKGEMAADEAVESLIDRGASHFGTVIHQTISHAVTVGCCAVGSFVGGIFGPAGAAAGKVIGTKIAGFLNTNLSPYIHKGIEKVKGFAKNVYQKGKSLLKSVGRKIANFFGF
ncbi:MAG: hypothetical protein MJ033_00370 [Victivallaceae bacterium]|nr:hypothetical protein [Victivallaceae bacterium]